MKRITIEIECTDDQFKNHFIGVEEFKENLESTVGTQIMSYKVDMVDVAE